MKALNIFSLLVSGALLLGSCSDDEIVTQSQSGGSTPTPITTAANEKEIISYDFERGSNTEGFYYTTIAGSGVVRRSIKKLSSLSSGDSRCGLIYSGKGSEFTKWKSYDFSGNTTNFLGYDMGKCGGVSEGIAHRNFTLTKDYKKGSLKLAFNYYKPGDFTGWNSYYLEVYISKRGADGLTGEEIVKNHIIKIDPKIDNSGWVTYKEALTKDLPKGKYTLSVRAGGSAGVDDIKFLEVEKKNEEPTPTSTNEKEIISYDFERGSNTGLFYYTRIEGSRVARRIIKKLSSLDSGDSRCGLIYSGKATEFTKWKSYDFSGNKTNFLGYDMGKCGGVSEGIAHRNFTLRKDYKKGSLKLAFKYYKPGDFTGWDSYYLEVYISKRGASSLTGEEIVKRHIIKIDPKIDSSGWVTYKETLTKDLSEGVYTLSVRAGGSAGIDDIKFLEVVK